MSLPAVIRTASTRGVLVASAIAVSAFVAIADVVAQEGDARSAVPAVTSGDRDETATTSRRRPRLFLMCPEECFDAYLRQELSYFDLVRDPLLADFTIVIVRQPAANGGERFSVTVARMDEGIVADAGASARAVATDPAATTLALREALRDAVIRALHAELVGTAYESAFSIGLPVRGADEVSDLDDPWNYWVFAPALEATAEVVGDFYYVNLAGSFTVRRFTSRDKLRLRVDYERDLTGYTLEDGTRPRGDVYRASSRVLYARSLGQHLSLGGIAVSTTAEFENLEGHLHAAAVVEVNAFPFTQNARRQLRLALQVGSWTNWYFERTLRDEDVETHPYHAISLIADVNERWGSVAWVGQFNQFVDEPKLFRLSTGAVATLRVAAGLAISLEGRFAWVRDQISLRLRPITDEELLLWTAQQPTEFDLYAKVNVSYTFGSVLNTVVNPRFGRIDLEED